SFPHGFSYYKDDGDKVKNQDETVVNEKEPLTPQLLSKLSKTPNLGTIHHRSKIFYPVTIRSINRDSGHSNVYAILEAISEKEIAEYYSALEVLSPTNFSQVLLQPTQPLTGSDGEKGQKPTLVNLYEHGIQQISAYLVPHNQRARSVIHQTLSTDKVGMIDNDRSFYLRSLGSLNLSTEEITIALVSRYLSFEEIDIQ
ncbi:DNA-directed RNA polymerase, beta subunit, partial [mine drainage metagenome]